MAFTCKIKCADFCDYNKELFCPFYKKDGEGDISESEYPKPIEDEEIEEFDDIVFTARQRGPLLKKKKGEKIETMEFTAQFYLPNTFKDEDGQYQKRFVEIHGTTNADNTSLADLDKIIVDGVENISEATGNCVFSFGGESDFAGITNMDFELFSSEFISVQGNFESEYNESYKSSLSDGARHYNGTIDFSFNQEVINPDGTTENKIVTKTEAIDLYTSM